MTDISAYLSPDELAPRPNHGLALYVRNTGTGKGRGVFSARRFRRGELVETAPVIVFTSACSLPRIIANVLYNWEQQTGEPNTRAIALGYGSLYNHDNPASLSYTADRSARLIRYIAARDIAADEELTINYSAAKGECASAEDNWFERHGVKRWSPSGSD
jgi:uncharacterized protein